MQSAAAGLSRWGCILLVLGALGCSSCGGDEPPGSVPPAPPGSSAGSPASTVPQVGAADLLARMVRSVAVGPALATKDLSADVTVLRELLWPDLAQPGVEAAALAHVRAAHVAGGVASELWADPGAREALLQRDPFGLGLHDAWVAAARKGPDAYKAWCADEAPALFRRREEELQRLFERPMR